MASFPFAGLKKQLNKANQYVSERIMTGVEGTKLDNEFQDMENRTDIFNEMVEDLQVPVLAISVLAEKFSNNRKKITLQLGTTKFLVC
jgi:hypothetical protein